MQLPTAPVTEYCVLVAGVTVIVELVAPVLQVYVLAPLTDKEADCPGHMVLLETITGGPAPTITVVVAVLVQPADVPVTVYCVVTVGLTEMEAVVALVFHT